MKSVTSLKDLEGKRVCIRVDFNVDVENGRVVDDFRIRKALPTIEYLIKEEARIILISHFSEGESLKDVSRYCQRFFANEFAHNLEEAKNLLDNMFEGGVVFLENIRMFDGEVENDPSFSQKIASLADFYVNEAFSVSHREHASVVGVPKIIPAYAGLRFMEEVRELSDVINPKKPFVFVLGGAKFDTKIPLVEKFLEKADVVFIGGALANDVWKAMGMEVGSSRVSDCDISLNKIIESDNLMLPVDVITVCDRKQETKTPEEVGVEDKIVDAGPKTIELLVDQIKDAKMVLWNGPFGYYEDGFSEGTEAFARQLSLVDGMAIIGGGDTLTAVSNLGVRDSFHFVSTGGGAMLDFLANETLPGIEALE